MVWSSDPVKQEEMAGYSRKVLSIDEHHARHQMALQQIAYCSAYGHDSTFLGTLAMCALYPQDYLAALSKEDLADINALKETNHA